MSRAPSQQDPFGRTARQVDSLVAQAGVLLKQNRFAEAELLCRNALQLDSRNGQALHLLGTARRGQGFVDEALKLIERALERGVAIPQAYVDYGIAWRLSGDLRRAAMWHRKAIARDARWSSAHFHLAQVLLDLGDTSGAIAAYEVCLAIDENDAAACVNLGNIYKKLERYEEALRYYDAAYTIIPTLAVALRNSAATLREQGYLHASVALLDRAHAVAPEDKPIQSDLAATLLQVGDFERGWAQYENRYENPEDFPAIRRPQPPPYWTGGDLSEQTLLVFTEQGIGDEVLHGSMIAEVGARAKRCIVECSTRMVPVFKRSFPAFEIIGREDGETPLDAPPGVSCQICAASLGQFVRPTFAKFPKHSGYLRADPAKTASYRQRYLSSHPGQRLVGLSWRSTNAVFGISKSMKLADFGPILNAPGITFINLQYGSCGAELAKVEAALSVKIIHDPEIDPLRDMDSFFAQVAAMDLVVTTSNTTAHAAGAQNVPVWILLPPAKGALWYWFTRRTDSPWYPSARLLRQAWPDVTRPWWEETVRRAAADMANWRGGQP